MLSAYSVRSFARKMSVISYPPLDLSVFNWLNSFKLQRFEALNAGHDALCLVTVEDTLNSKINGEQFSGCFSTLQQYKEADKAFENNVSLIVMNSDKSPWRKVIHSSIGPLDRDYDDVRRFGDAASKAVERALKSGAKKILLAIPSSNHHPQLKAHSDYIHFDLVSVLQAYSALYVPLELREIPGKASFPELFEFTGYDGDLNQTILPIAKAIESGRVVCRDIGGSDPERMAPPMVADYVQQVFAGTCIKVEVVRDENIIQKEFPLLAAVNRGARGHERHRARVIFLTYEPTDGYDTTIVLVGKGVTFDTGGANVKVGAAMIGMHRDKCGSAAVAGFFKVLADLKPKRIKVLGAMCMVRNSIGSDCYIPDEIITARSGQRVRVVNTDAEGRMAMADPLCKLKEMVADDKDPHLFTIATLTGHAVIAFGEGYSGILPNGPARKANLHTSIQEAGRVMGDMFEVSTLRREDFDFHNPPSVYEDLIQCNTAPSTRTERGHQKPAAFLILVSGLDKHGIDSQKPLKYCHIDIAGSSGPCPGIPTGAPIPALVKRFVLPNL